MLLNINIHEAQHRLKRASLNGFPLTQIRNMTFATIIFTIIYHYYDLILLVLLTKNKTEIKINSFCVAQKKKSLCFILKRNADKQTLEQFLQMKFVMDMVTCILA